MPKYKDYDEYLLEELKNPEFARAFINLAFEEYFEDNDSQSLARSLDYLVKANGGVSKIAEVSGLDRTNIYKIFRNEISPKLDTIYKLLNAMNYTLQIVPIDNAAEAR